ncbi:MAG: site-2 protease family protein [Candidatus Thermoplasmatota archaeon]|nr:site-2 protease family protein [Candidatus Thermoplasmatota archaeon]
MDEWKSFPLDRDSEQIKQKVEKYFSIYGAREGEIDSFYIHMPSGSKTLEEKFECLRLELKEMDLIPFLRYDKGEYILLVTKKPKLKTRPNWLNIILFFTTIVTTTLSGSIIFLLQYMEWGIKEMFLPQNLLNGLVFFSFPLMAILGIHELGHYFVSKKHNVAASLPFFIPIPPNPILPLGTLGAVISMREPIPDRKALIEIGIAGPIAGFLVSIPVLIVGLYMSDIVAISSLPENALTLGDSLMTLLLSNIMFAVPEGYILSSHPTAFAGWVGLLVTAINLLPVGQLDGGHIARGALKEKHKYASIAAVALLILSSLLGGGWLFMAFFIVFIIGVGHPPALNEFVPLDTKMKGLVLLAILIFILSFIPVPIS